MNRKNTEASWSSIISPTTALSEAKNLIRKKWKSLWPFKYSVNIYFYEHDCCHSSSYSAVSWSANVKSSNQRTSSPSSSSSSRRTVPLCCGLGSSCRTAPNYSGSKTVAQDTTAAAAAAAFSELELSPPPRRSEVRSVQHWGGVPSVTRRCLTCTGRMRSRAALSW